MKNCSESEFFISNNRSSPPKGMNMRQQGMTRIMRSTVTIVCVTMMACVCVVNGQSKAEKIDALMSLFHEYGQFNGSVLVAEHGTVIYKKGFGYANFEWGIPNQPDTKFRLGSITKQFTSMLVLQLVRQGKLTLDGKITDYLPDYPSATGGKITIHHLLTHSSGIPNYTSYPKFYRELSRQPSSPADFIKLFADSSLQFEPGSNYAYSNSGYFLLGVIIEKVTGKSYEQVLQEQIFTPLHMAHSGYDRSETILKNRAQGYEKAERGFVNASFIDMSLPFAAGALYSTVEDLYLWDQALYTDRLLPDETRNLLFTPHIPTNGASYGYGWSIGVSPIGRSADSARVIEHGGGINGFNTLISRIPSEKDLVVLLNNTGGARLEEMNRAIRGILYEKPYNNPRKSLTDTVVAAIEQSGIDAAMTLYRDLKDHQADLYEVIEREMNVAGYRQLQRGRVKEAIELFRINVENFPKSSNVYDSLGEAYLAHGETELAITNYQKSVDLDPRNVNGAEILKKLRTAH